MRNPLNKRFLRELKGELAKYIVIFVFMTAVIGLISGFLIADGSMYDTYNKSFEKYNIEDGNFELYSKADDKTTDQEITTDLGKVGFTFKHLLSRVKFTFKNTFPANAAAKISVKDVKITDAYQNGTITPAEENAVWNATNNTLSVVFASDNVKDLVADTGSGETEHMYLIPVASPQYTVTFTVVLDQNRATTEYPHTSTITTGMEKSKSYNFIAELNEKNITEDELFPIKFTAEVDPWGAFTNNDITVE